MKFVKKVLLLGIIMICGCGGGGSGGVLTPPVSTALRQRALGDKFVYSFTGTYTPRGGSQRPATGHLDVTCPDRSSAMVTVTENLFLSVSRAAVGIYHSRTDNQGADGSVRLIADDYGPNGFVRTVKSGSFALPGSWTVMSRSATLGFDVGQAQTSRLPKPVGTESQLTTLDVAGAETVTVPAGTFGAWRAEYSAVSTSGLSIKKTLWVVPNLGDRVKEVVDVTDEDGNRYAGTLELTSFHKGQ